LNNQSLFIRIKKIAKRGGNVAGNARKETEKEIGKSVVSKSNYLESGESQNLLQDDL